VAEIRTIAGIVAGTMGRGIAHVATLGGYRTILGSIRCHSTCFVKRKSMCLYLTWGFGRKKSKLFQFRMH
jgi:3-hydroxyacyl-CoA dehydrogenase